MRKGSGMINPSSYGYNIGDRIKTTSLGSSTNSKLISDYTARVGDEGIITGVNKDHTEIFYNNGRFGTRYEYNCQQNFKIIEKTTPTYDIY